MTNTSNFGVITLLGAAALLAGCQAASPATGPRRVNLSEVMESGSHPEPVIASVRLGAGDEYGALVHQVYLARHADETGAGDEFVRAVEDRLRNAY